MPAIDLMRDIPGYAEKVRREEEIRAIAFLGIPETIGGLPVAALTLRRVQWLSMMQSPFLRTVPVAVLLEKPDIATDIIGFLWVVSPLFRAGDARRRQRFNKKYAAILKQPAEKVLTEIMEYVEEAFLDSGEKDLSGDQRSYYSSAASIVGFFHRHYGLPLDCWQNDPVRNWYRRITGQVNPLDLPLKLAFQLIRVHQRSVNPELKFTNRLSEPVIKNHFAELNKQFKRN